MSKITLKDKFSYAFDNIIGKGTPVLIIGLGFVFFFTAFLTAIVVFIGQISEGTVTEPMDFKESYWQSLMHVIDQGTVTGESGWTYRIIMFPVSLIGILLVSTLVSILNAGFQTKIDELKKGKSIVIEENHTVILGWSTKIFPIINELVLANLNQKKACIVILADRDKTEMEDELKVKVPFKGTTKIICRSGNPKDIDDIKIANLNEAKSIIILAPEEEKSDTYVIKSIMAIVNNPNRKKSAYNIIAEIDNEVNVEIAKIVGKNELTILAGNEVISKITVQSSRQAGLSIVYSQLLGYDDMEIYILPVENALGKTFNDMLFAFEDICAIGIRKSNGTVELNPPLDTQMEKGDQLVVIAEDDIELKYEAKEISFDPLPYNPNASHSGYETHKTLILGWNSNTKIVIKELDNYVRMGSELYVMAECDESTEEKIKQLGADLKNQKFKFTRADINDRNELNKIDFKNYDHVIIVSYSDDYSIQEADAITLITLMHVRDILKKINHRTSLVTEMLDWKNRALADLNKADDFIISDRIISLILAQISENKELAIVFEDLFDAEGNEIYIKSYKEYMAPSTRTNFYSVLHAASQRKEVAFGYIKSKFADDPANGYGVVLNPIKSELISFEDDDKIIVISES
ncbi:MAG: hypothetical protein MUF42_08835 [Cytophagaceae bacterium]|jgi:Na+-transporting methylmalonyl-CoA/oxaloacetate decarboxylase gamma subunit|nr:hypothetical protein [Cytophagaceae bacterium]